MRLILSGLVDGGVTAVLHTSDHIEVRLPAFFIPKGAVSGTVLDFNITVEKSSQDQEVGRVRSEK